MTIYQFLALDKIQQEEVIFNAVYIGTYRTETYVNKCYQQDDFYIETRLKLKGGEKDMRAFPNVDLLKP